MSLPATAQCAQVSSGHPAPQTDSLVPAKRGQASGCTLGAGSDLKPLKLLIESAFRLPPPTSGLCTDEDSDWRAEEVFTLGEG